MGDLLTTVQAFINAYDRYFDQSAGPLSDEEIAERLNTLKQTRKMIGLVSLGRWRCGHTNEMWDGDISNHHGIKPYCPGPHKREEP